VVRWKTGLTDAQCDALAIADNKLGEAARWDTDLLAPVMADIVDAGLVAPVGFSDAELDKLLGDIEGVATEEEVDSAIRNGLRMRMGPFELRRFVGIETADELRKNLELAHGIRYRLPPRVTG
jgi:hypothetical protein